MYFYKDGFEYVCDIEEKPINSHSWYTPKNISLKYSILHSRHLTDEQWEQVIEIVKNNKLLTSLKRLLKNRNNIAFIKYPLSWGWSVCISNELTGEGLDSNIDFEEFIESFTPNKNGIINELTETKEIKLWKK